MSRLTRNPNGIGTYVMIQMQTSLDVADNSGARRLMCIKVRSVVPTGAMHRSATSSRSARQGSDSARQGQEGRRHNAVVVRTRKGVRRADGSLIRFDGNAAVLLRTTSWSRSVPASSGP